MESVFRFTFDWHLLLGTSCSGRALKLASNVFRHRNKVPIRKFICAISSTRTRESYLGPGLKLKI